MRSPRMAQAPRVDVTAGITACAVTHPCPWCRDPLDDGRHDRRPAPGAGLVIVRCPALDAEHLDVVLSGIA